MLMAINSLEAVHKNPTIETSKQIDQFLKSHPDAVTEYRRIGIIIYIYLNASYISEPDARSRSSGFFSKKKFNTPIQAIPLDNSPVHV